MKHAPRTVLSTAVLAAAISVAGCAPREAATPKSTTPAAAQREPAPLLPRTLLFGNPERTNPQVSHDGKHLSWLAPRDGVMNVWVAPVDAPSQARPVTAETTRGIRTYRWAFNHTHILYLQDRGGDESWKVYSVDVATGNAKDLTPFDSVPGPDGSPIVLPSGKMLRPTALLRATSPKFPDEVVIGLNNRNAQFHDLHRVSITTGHMIPIIETDQFAEVIVDNNFKMRLAMTYTDDGGNNWTRFDNESEEFLQWEEVPMEDAAATRPWAFDDSGRTLYMADSRGRDTAAAYAVDLDTGAKKQIAASDAADVDGSIVHPATGALQAVGVNRLRREWVVVDSAIAPDLSYLRTVDDGDLTVLSRSLDDRAWVVSYSQDTGPTKFYLYTRADNARQARHLFNDRPELESARLAPMHALEIRARDGLSMVSYLTLPPDCDRNNDARPDAGPVPMVLVVHGGPWARDTWGYNSRHQWLANRGYAVLSVNFRGSSGFGKKLINAGNREWAGAMHNDLLDAVDWAVAGGVARKDKVAIMGASYGGYATLVGLTFTPDVFACGVDIVGPSNIVTLLKSIPPHWAPAMKHFALRVGDPATEEGRRFLTERSPISRVSAIRRPLLIGQGANDPRVKQAESDQIVSAMQEQGIPVTYILFPDEGHGFQRPENNTAFNAATEAFLARHLGGRAEPVGEDLAKSTAEVRAGGEFLNR